MRLRFLKFVVVAVVDGRHLYRCRRLGVVGWCRVVLCCVVPFFFVVVDRNFEPVRGTLAIEVRELRVERGVVA